MYFSIMNCHPERSDGPAPLSVHETAAFRVDRFRAPNICDWSPPQYKRKLTSTLICAATGLPSFLAGSKRQVFTASIAFSSKPNPRVASNSDVARLTIRTNHHLQARRFPGYLALRASSEYSGSGSINLFRSRNSTAHAKHSTAGAAAVARAESGTFARTDAASATGADAAARAGSIRRHRRQMRQRIAQVGQVGLLQLNFGRNHDRRWHFELRMQVAHHGHGRSELLHRLLRQTALRCLQFVAIATTTAAAAHGLRRLAERGKVIGRDQHNRFFRLVNFTILRPR